MKIGHYSDPHISGTAGVKPAGATGAASPVGSAVGDKAQGVSVNLSREAKSLSGTSGGQADMDMAKVEAFRAAIANGSYKVNPGVIADKLLGNAQEMLDRVRT